MHYRLTVLLTSLLTAGACSENAGPGVSTDDSARNIVGKEIPRIVLSGTPEADVIDGGPGDERLLGKEGRDILQGNGGRDEYHGGPGNDGIFGGNQDDTYYYNIGDRVDSIQDEGGSADQLVFGEGIRFEDLEFVNEYAGLRISVRGPVEQDSILIFDWGKQGNFIESLIVNGQRYSHTQVEAAITGNRRPKLIRQIEDQRAIVGKAFRFDVPEDAFIDPDADNSLNYYISMADWSRFPAWLDHHLTGGAIVGTPTPDDVGELDIEIEAKDAGGLTAVTYLKIVVVENE